MRNIDSRRTRKAAQRHQTILVFALLGIACFVVTISWFTFNYGSPTKPVNPGAQTSALTNSPDVTYVTDPSLTPASTPTVNVTPAQTDAQQQISQQVNERLTGMSLAQKTGQMILMGLGGKELAPGECQIIQAITPGGIVFHGGNVSDANQLRSLISDLKNCSGQTSSIPLFFALDHEGQYINRFKSGDLTIFPSAQALGATGEPRYAFRVALAGGQELSSAGINMVLGPVADVLTNYDNTVIGERSFGSDPQRVGDFVAQAVQGYRQAGLIPVLKHFPGHGASSVDSHLGLPVDNATVQSLFMDHFPPFLQGLNANAQVVMIGHIALPQIDSSNQPASLSAPIVNLLRNDLEFNGVVITDSLDMGALQSTGLDSPGVALASVKAGVDMLLILSASDAQNASNRIQSAVEQGEISIEQVNDSARRILNLKEQNNLLTGYPAMYSPDFTADQALADEAGYHAVAVLKNPASLIPIPTEVASVLVITPPDVWGLDAMFSSALQSKGFIPQFVHYPEPWLNVTGDDGMIQSFAAQAANADMTIVLTWQAHTNRVLYGNDWQGRLVSAIQKTGPRLIVASLKSPTDILDFPEVSTFMSTFGTTPGQLRALMDILSGNWVATGVNPLPQLP